MKKHITHAKRTRDRLLTAAIDAFAAKGYRDATIEDICARAGANIAAVNYHFGSKKALYIETWRHCFAESVRKHSPDGGVPAAASPEARLRGLVKALVSRIADESNKEFLILQKERANPTDLLHEVMRRELWPLHERTEIVVRELLGSHVSDMQVRFCETSIISQCIDPVLVGRGAKTKRDARNAPPGVDDIEAYGDHVVEFSLAGMCAIREDAERKQKSVKRRRRSGDASKRE